MYHKQSLLPSIFIQSVTLPLIAEVVRWLRHHGAEIFDGDDENDNVDNTRLAYVRLDALNALKAIEQELGVAAM